MLQRFSVTIPVSVKFTLPLLELHYSPPPNTHMNYPLWSVWVTQLMSTKTYIFTDVFDHPQCCDRNAKTESCAVHCTYQMCTCCGHHVLSIMIKNSGRPSPLNYTDRTTIHYLLFSLYLFCVWSHSAVMRQARTNSTQERFVCTRSFRFVWGSALLKTTVVKFFAESYDVSYKDLIGALTKLL